MRVLLVLPQVEPVTVDIESTLQAKQKLVGGPIEVLHFAPGNDAVIILNEVGRLLGLPVNRMVNGHSVCGPFLVCGYNSEGDLLDLTEDQLRLYSELFSLHADNTQLN